MYEQWRWRKLLDLHTIRQKWLVEHILEREENRFELCMNSGGGENY